MKGASTSCITDKLNEENEQSKKCVRELEVKYDLARIEARKAWDHIRATNDEVEEAKLELMHAKKGFEDEPVKARAQTVEDFKKSKEFKTLLRQ